MSRNFDKAVKEVRPLQIKHTKKKMLSAERMAFKMSVKKELRDAGYKKNSASTNLDKIEEEKFEAQNAKLKGEFISLLPDYSARLTLLPSQEHINQLKELKNPPLSVREIMTTFLLLLASYKEIEHSTSDFLDHCVDAKNNKHKLKAL